jgi:hypothetical protein
MAAVPGRLPLIEPMLAAPARDVPANADDWAAEAKWDGARAIAYAFTHLAGSSRAARSARARVAAAASSAETDS